MHKSPQLEAVLLVDDDFEDDLHELAGHVAFGYRTVILAEAADQGLEFLVLYAENTLCQLLLQFVEEARCSFLHLHGRPH